MTPRAKHWETERRSVSRFCFLRPNHHIGFRTNPRCHHTETSNQMLLSYNWRSARLIRQKKNPNKTKQGWFEYLQQNSCMMQALTPLHQADEDTVEVAWPGPIVIWLILSSDQNKNQSSRKWDSTQVKTSPQCVICLVGGTMCVCVLLQPCVCHIERKHPAHMTDCLANYMWETRSGQMSSTRQWNWNGNKKKNTVVSI